MVLIPREIVISEANKKFMGNLSGVLDVKSDDKSG